MGFFNDDDPKPKRAVVQADLALPRPSGRAKIIEPAQPAERPVSRRARLAPGGGFFGDEKPTADELRLQPLREGCRGRAYFYEGERLKRWNMPDPPPGLKYRFTLMRDWGPYDSVDQPFVAFLGMNPALANATHDDHTSRVYIGFTEKLGYQSYIALNVTPIVSQHPDILTNPDMQEWIVNPGHQTMLTGVMGHTNCKAIILCFGSLPAGSAVEREARRIVAHARVILPSKALLCFGINMDGSPRHLSRLAYDTPCVEFPQWG